MEQLNLRVNSRYIHKKTTNEYIIVDINKMKHPDTGKWLPAVIYRRYNDNATLWCRTVEDFKKHFTELIISNDEIYL